MKEDTVRIGENSGRTTTREREPKGKEKRENTHINLNLLLSHRNIRPTQLGTRLTREQPFLTPTTNTQNPTMFLGVSTSNDERRTVVFVSALDGTCAETVEGEGAGHGHPADASRVADEDFVLLDVDRFVPEAEEGA